jgi:hypothetical protein
VGGTQLSDSLSGANYKLDRVSNNDKALGITMVNPPVDSVGQFTGKWTLDRR